MTVSVPKFSSTIGAVASAAVVTLGLVTVPPERYDSAIARAEIGAVQFHVALATQVSALANSAAHTAATASPSSAAGAVAPDARTPQASALSPTDALGALAATVLGGAIWFLAFPITLPLSIFVGFFLPAFGFGGATPISLFLWPLAALQSLIADQTGGSIPAASARRPAASASATQEVESNSATVSDTQISAVDQTLEVKKESGRSLRSQRGSTQRGRSITRPATTTNASADTPSATPAAVPATATPDETITPTQSELAADATSPDAANTAADASSTATQQSNQAPSRQREGKTRATRAASGAGRAS